MSGSPRYVGIDQSLTGTGLIILDEHGGIIKEKLITTKSSQKIEDRFIDIFENIYLFIKPGDKIYIEGLSLYSTGQRLAEIFALHYIIRLKLHENEYNYTIIPPKTLKKWITDNGNAKKDLMMLKIYKRWGIEFTNNNLADAYALAKYGMALDNNETELPKPKQKKIRKKKNE